MKHEEIRQAIIDKSPGLTGDEVFWLTCEIMHLNPTEGDSLFTLLKSLLGEKTNG